MKILRSILALLLAFNVQATSYTEFYSVNGGFNGNAGSSTSTTATYTSTNGNWNGTDTFTPADGSTPASTVSVGMWGSVYLDGATTAVYIGRITAVGAGVNGTITVSTSAKAGTAPSNGATGRTIKVGGAWTGPSGASGFPISFVTLAMTNATPDRPRFNFKNDQEYNVSSAINQPNAGPMRFQGYTSTPGDGGKAVITANGVGSAIALLTLNGNMIDLVDFVVRSNGTSSTATLLTVNGNNNLIQNVHVNKSRGNGIVTTGSGTVVEACEASTNSLSNTANEAGFANLNGVGVIHRNCISHHNTSANAAGFYASGNGHYVGCISAVNGTNGYTHNGSTANWYMDGCEAYNNGGHGVQFKGTSSTVNGVFIVNCNLLKNTLYGISSQSANSNKVGYIAYLGFGSGSQTNGSGQVDTGSGKLGGIDIRDDTFVNYASGVTPWVNPDGGNFDLTNSQSLNQGRGKYSQLGADYTGTQAYPDIGAATHTNTTASRASSFPISN